MFPNPGPTVSGWEKATFKGCNLKSLSLLGLAVGSSIGENSFYNCSTLSRCVLPTDITTIGQQAFTCCTSLTEITLPTTLTNIDKRAFFGCSSLTSLTFPASLTTIGSEAFYYCSSLTHLDLSALTNATIGFSAFDGCERLVKLTLPAALSRIEKWTFSRCSALIELTLPAALNCIDQLAFEECTSLTTVIFPATLRLTYVGVTKPPWAHTRHTPWKPCTLIETVHLSYLKNTPLLAAESAFSRCTSLSKLILPDAPKVSKSLRTALPQLHRALKKSGAKPVPKLTWSAPATLATIGDRASSGCPRLAKLPNQRRCPHYRYRRVRLLLQQLWKSELEVWIAELEIRAGTPPGTLYSAESARQSVVFWA